MKYTLLAVWLAIPFLGCADKKADPVTVRMQADSTARAKGDSIMGLKP